MTNVRPVSPEALYLGVTGREGRVERVRPGLEGELHVRGGLAVRVGGADRALRTELEGDLLARDRLAVLVDEVGRRGTVFDGAEASGPV